MDTQLLLPRKMDSSAEAVGSICKRDRTGVLISPSSLCPPENNHTLPSNILSIRQNSRSPYTRARGSHCRERWSVNRMGSLHPPAPRLYPPFSLTYSWRQMRFNMLYGMCTVRMSRKGKTEMFISDAPVASAGIYLKVPYRMHF